MPAGRRRPGQRQRTAARDLDAVLEGLGQVVKQRRHLRRRLEVLLRRVGPRTAGVVEPMAAVNADARLVGLELVPCEEAHVIGRDQRGRQAVDQREDARDVRLLVRAADTLDLEIEAVAEQGLPAFEQCLCLAPAAGQQRPPDVAARGAGQCDQSRGRSGIEPLAREQRAAAPLPLEVAARHQTGEVAKPREILGDQRQQDRLRALAAAVDPEVRSDQGLHALLLRLAVELHHRKEIAVVGQGHGRHAGRGYRLHEPRHADNAVQERVLGVQPQVDERRAAGTNQRRGHAQKFTVSRARNCAGEDGRGRLARDSPGGPRWHSPCGARNRIPGRASPRVS